MDKLNDNFSGFRQSLLTCDGYTFRNSASIMSQFLKSNIVTVLSNEVLVLPSPSTFHKIATDEATCISTMLIGPNAKFSGHTPRKDHRLRLIHDSITFVSPIAEV